jgi:hypothetical protein
MGKSPCQRPDFPARSASAREQPTPSLSGQSTYTKDLSGVPYDLSRKTDELYRKTDDLYRETVEPYRETDGPYR